MLQRELVDWVDAWGVSPDWEDLEPLAEYSPIYVSSLGWVVAETDKVLVLASNLSREHPETGEQFCGKIVIPKVCIQKRHSVVLRELGGS